MILSENPVSSDIIYDCHSACHLLGLKESKSESELLMQIWEGLRKKDFLVKEWFGVGSIAHGQIAHLVATYFSHIHRMVKVGRDLWRSFGPTPLPSRVA